MLSNEVRPSVPKRSRDLKKEMKVTTAANVERYGKKEGNDKSKLNLTANAVE